MPALPSNVDLVPVRGKFIYADGTAPVGRVQFTPQAARAVDIDALTTILGKTIAAYLDDDGSFEIAIPATDDPDITPSNFTYAVKEDFSGGSSYSISVPLALKDDGIDLAAVAPASPNTGSGVEQITRLEFEAYKNGLESDIDSKHASMDQDIAEIRSLVDQLEAIENPNFSGDIHLGGADTDLILVKGVWLEVDARSTEVAWVDDSPTTITEKSGSTVVKTTQVTYTDSTPTGIVESISGKTITTTISRDANGHITGFTRSVT